MTFTRPSQHPKTKHKVRKEGADDTLSRPYVVLCRDVCDFLALTDAAAVYVCVCVCVCIRPQAEHVPRRALGWRVAEAWATAGTVRGRGEG